jgi:hypothetical protein
MMNKVRKFQVNGKIFYCYVAGNKNHQEQSKRHNPQGIIKRELATIYQYVSMFLSLS